MIPRRPYLLRAFYDWLIDNELTPYLMVDTRSEEVIIPRQYVQDEQIILNIAPSVVSDLILANEEVCFDAYFGGVPFSVVIPMASILAIYAQENGLGTFFEPEVFEKKETHRQADVIRYPTHYYNQVRPHSGNHYFTPLMKKCLTI